jgi:hypothetical protein
VRFANESYVLGVPERLLVAAAREIGWHIMTVDRHPDATYLTVRRTMRLDRHVVVLPADMRRRHVVNTVRVRLRMLGA